MPRFLKYIWDYCSRKIWPIRVRENNFNIKADSFFGYVDTSDKNNFLRTYRVAEDGVIRVKVRLAVHDDRLREEIIANHFLSFAVSQGILDSPPRLIARDSPWDFSYDNGLFIEVTSFAEGQETFVWQNSRTELVHAIENRRSGKEISKKGEKVH